MAAITEPLAVARRRLEDAVHALADPVPERVGDVCRWADPVYVRLRFALRGRVVGHARTRTHRSVLPCRVDVLALLVEIDGAVAAWEPNAKTTLDRLHQLVARSWRPQDCAVMDDYCALLQRWVVDAAELIAPEPRVFLPMPCPGCGARFAYHCGSGGERVRTRALRVSECRCLACGAVWGADRFHWLARLLGCPALPA